MKQQPDPVWEKVYPISDISVMKLKHYDKAIIGVCNNTHKIIYSVPKVIEIMRQRYNMSNDDAMLHYAVDMQHNRRVIWCSDVIGDILDNH